MNYDPVVNEKIEADPYAVVRWRHAPGDASRPGSGAVCWNNVSGCFNDPKRINNPANKCGFHISAAAYNWSNPALGDWYLEKVIKPTLVHGDGIWLDGIGPDNGAYMCAGVCCGYGANNSPLVQPEIDAHCAGQYAATTKAQKYLIANGGWEAQKCFDYLSGDKLPTKADSPAQCAAKLDKWSRWGADHSNYNFVVAYGSRTGGRDGYDDASVNGTVAAFLLMRGQHWLFSIAATGGGSSSSAPPYAQKSGSLTADFARAITSDYGKPLGTMAPVAGKPNVFERRFEKATVSLDCNTFTPSVSV